MRKIIVAISIFMFAATALGYDGIYNNQAAEEEGYTGGIYSNHSVDAEEEDYSGSGIFRSSAPSPGERPDNGEGIGQEDGEDAPIGDGLTVMLTCSVLLVVVKLVAKKFKR